MPHKYPPPGQLPQSFLLLSPLGQVWFMLRNSVFFFLFRLFMYFFLLLCVFFLRFFVGGLILSKGSPLSPASKKGLIICLSGWIEGSLGPTVTHGVAGGGVRWLELAPGNRKSCTEAPAIAKFPGHKQAVAGQVLFRYRRSVSVHLDSFLCLQPCRFGVFGYRQAEGRIR